MISRHEDRIKASAKVWNPQTVFKRNELQIEKACVVISDDEWNKVV